MDQQQGGGPRQPWQSPGEYPRQELTEQQVLPGRSRTPWLIGIGAAVAALAVAFVLWLVLNDDGESGRAAYCDALSEATDGGNLMGVLESADQNTVASFEEVADLAPDAVADDWDALVSLARDPEALSQQNAMGAALDAFSSLRSIARDAQDECGIDLDIPLG